MPGISASANASASALYLCPCPCLCPKFFATGMCRVCRTLVDTVLISLYKFLYMLHKK